MYSPFVGLNFLGLLRSPLLEEIRCFWILFFLMTDHVLCSTVPPPQPPLSGCCLYLAKIHIGLKDITRVMPLLISPFWGSDKVEGFHDGYAPTCVLCFGD